MEVNDDMVRGEDARVLIHEIMQNLGLFPKSDYAHDHNKRSWWQRWWGYEFHVDYWIGQSDSTTFQLHVGRGFNVDGIQQQLEDIEKNYNVKITVVLHPGNFPLCCHTNHYYSGY